MKIPPRTLRIKFYLFFVLLMAALFLFIAVTSAWELRQATPISVAVTGMSILERASLLIDGDAFERLAQTLDPSDPFFIETQRKLRALKKETQILRLYTMAIDENGVHRFIIDADSVDSENFAYLGKKEDISDYHYTFMLAHVTRRPQITPSLHRTRLGSFISAYRPILNSGRKVVGIIGVNFSGEDLHSSAMSMMAWQIVFAVLIIAGGMIICFLLLKELACNNREQ